MAETATAEQEATLAEQGAQDPPAKPAPRAEYHLEKGLAQGKEDRRG